MRRGLETFHVEKRLSAIFLCPFANTYVILGLSKGQNNSLTIAVPFALNMIALLLYMYLYVSHSEIF